MPKIKILKILLKNLPDKNSKLDKCEEFFSIIASILKSSGDLIVDEDDQFQSSQFIAQPPSAQLSKKQISS